MQTNEFVLEIPYGTRDFLPSEAAEKRAIEAELAGVFARWGYDEVVTPTIEYLDTLTIGNGQALEPHMFKFFDKNNRTLALRHEYVPRIQMMVAERKRMSAELKKLPGFTVYPSATNFVLVKYDQAVALNEYLEAAGIGVRSFGNAPRLENCLRISMDRRSGGSYHKFEGKTGVRPDM